MASDSQSKWDKIYRDRDAEHAPNAAEVLQRYSHYLPDRGFALDLACGRGGNALLLAEAGLHVQAWDISPVAISLLAKVAHAKGLGINASVTDLSCQWPEKQSFDVIVCSYFLERKIFPSLIQALKPGGILFYETYNASPDRVGGPRNPDFLLEQGELLAIFERHHCIFYEELWGTRDNNKATGISRIIVRRKAVMA